MKIQPSGEVQLQSSESSTEVGAFLPKVTHSHGCRVFYYMSKAKYMYPIPITHYLGSFQSFAVAICCREHLCARTRQVSP